MRRRSFLQRGFAGAFVVASNATMGEDAGTEKDREVMRQLVAFTRQSFGTPYPVPFGAAVIRSGSEEMVARTLNQVGPLKDPTAHAEMQALRTACKRVDNLSLGGHTLYTTAEPCAMCMAAALWAGVDRVVYGATIADVSRHITQIRLSARDVVASSDSACEVTGPVERAACNALFEDPVIAPTLRLWKKRS
jgi:tRNA(Arg) A34 adenosine deaminase TadA